MVTRTVNTASGILTVVEADGIVHARGIPYAHADRFGEPVSVPMVDELEQDEHCLVLSVAAPVAARSAPVMVWFHGGAYVTGGGEAPMYDPDPLVRDGVVVVNVTSRLGGFGYLTPVGQSRSAGPDSGSPMGVRRHRRVRRRPRQRHRLRAVRRR